MNKGPALILGSLLLSLCSSALQAENLSDFERFRSYPYLDRSYREAKKQNWAEVERLTRHLLELVPKNEEARVLLVQALAKQRRYRDAMQAAEPLGNSGDYGDALLNLRLTWIAQDPPGPSQVQEWLAQSNGSQRVRLWQAYSLSLARFGGAKRALDWLNEVQPKGDENVLRLARANWAEQLRDWDTTIEELAPLAARGELPPKDWERLANAYIQKLDEKPLQALLQHAPTPAAARKARLAMADRAIALGHAEQAQRWLQTLPAEDLARPEQRQQLWELARETNDTRLVEQLSADLQRPCLETVDWLSRRDPQAALERLHGCRASDDPKTWLILAQRLQANDLLQTQRLPEPWDTARREQLLDALQQQGNSKQVLAFLAQQPQTPDVLKRRAELLQAGGRTREAAELWERHYRQSGSLASLDQATYLNLKNGERAHTRQLLEQAYDRHQGRLPPALLQRLAGMYTQADSPIDVQRMSALVNRVDPANRAQLLGRLAETGHCDAVRQAIGPQPTEVGQLRALGRCSMPDNPGQAVTYYQAAERLGDRGSRIPLAYALDAAGDPVAAQGIWNTLSPAEWTDNARLTAARSALNAHDPARAEQHWEKVPHTSADDWALGAAIAQQQNNPGLALERQRQALQHQPRADHYYAASVTAQQAGDTAQSTAWLAEAVRLDPAQPRYRADYGMRLAGADTPEVRRQSIPYLQQATAAFPEDYRLGETLAWRYAEAEDSAAAREELRRVLDVEETVVNGDDEYGSLEARKYRQRRAHETLSRRDSRTLASTWSPAGVSTNDNFLNTDSQQNGTQERRATSQNVQIAMWDHALGDEPSRNGSTLSVYARALLGGQGRYEYGQFLGTGVGLRYKPFGDSNLNLYSEFYRQIQLSDEDYDSLSLGETLNPNKVQDGYDDLINHGDSSNDLLLRATASYFDQGEYRNDWRIDENDWNERFLYLDAAWWTRAGDHAWLSRYQQGHAWKLPVNSPQTLMPYGFAEFASQDPDNDWRQDLRAGVGARWQWWFNGDRYNAYRGHLTVRTEYQQALGGNLYERANGVLLGVELDF
ncbi:NfrA family protein [Pseudomonas akapageensis]|uniref:NfrA family protein n=1 Tax=Pseudomonas akapageensis TaxID=2609961 RepID=UPI00140DFDDD|nr:phage receptor [Pseudomonas akapageensis]